MNKAKILTKFTKYYSTSFELEPDKSIKMSLPSEFNDLFDSQIHLTDEEIGVLATKYNCTESSIKYMISKRNNIAHVLSLSGNSADSINTANMWGIYANNGTGLAFEFDFGELEDRANQLPIKKLMQKFISIDNENYQGEMLKSDQILEKKREEKAKYCESLDGKLGLQLLKAVFEVVTKNKDISIFSDISTVIEQVDEFISMTRTNPSWNNKFLYKVSYTSDLKFLKSSFEAQLAQDLFLKKNLNTDFLNEIASIFSKTKLSTWEHEHEYRLVTAQFTNQDWLSRSTNINEQVKLLDDFIYKNSVNRYYYKFSKQPINSISDDNSGLGATLSINLPFPKKIYLGWSFDGTLKDEKGIVAMTKIKEFCQQHSVELYKLHKSFDSENGRFVSDRIL